MYEITQDTAEDRRPRGARIRRPRPTAAATAYDVHQPARHWKRRWKDKNSMFVNMDIKSYGNQVSDETLGSVSQELKAGPGEGHIFTIH